MGMYHKNHFVGQKFKQYSKRQTSKGMRRATKRSCIYPESITLSNKSKNLHGIDAWEFS